MTKETPVLRTASTLNITRDEAGARAELLDVDSYRVELDLTGDTTFRSETAVRFRCLRPGAATFIDLVAEDVSVIELNGAALSPGEAFDGSRIHLHGLAGDNTLRVVARCRYMRTGEGLHRFVDPIDGSVYLYSQFQVAYARRMFTVFDQPDLKATFAFAVTAPAEWEVVSNEPTPTPVPAAPGVATWRFAPTGRLSSYVTALVAGPYHRVDDEYRSGGRVVPLALFCRASLAGHLDADVLLDETRAGLAFFETMFARPYPFAKYDQLFVPEFNSGGMENAAAVTFTDDYVFRSRVPEVAYERRTVTVLHELAHMWFGDLVTMRWWDDLWLNEAFAEWASAVATAEATRWTGAWTTFTNTDKTTAYRADQLPSTHPIVAEIADLEDVEVNFDGITYAKGAAVLKLLAAWVGREQFVAGIQAYVKAHAWGNTTLADLLTVLADVSGRDLVEWSAEWLQTAGVNTLCPEFQTDGEGRFTSFQVLQTAPESWPTLRSHRLAVGLYDHGADGLRRRRSVEIDVAGERTDVPALLGERQPDLVLVNDDDLTYAKIRLDERSLATLTSSLGELRESLARSLCWSAAWDMTRDAEMATRDYVTLVLAGVGSEVDSSVVRTVLRQAEAAAFLFADPRTRLETRERLADGVLALMRSAEPGSDSQLQFVRAFASAAVTDGQLAVVRGLLSGTELVGGLGVDTDLRWHLLLQLVATGHAEDREIERELDLDDTATGRRQAAAARAARPRPEAKAQAWASLFDHDELPNAIQTATIDGFGQVSQLHLLRHYVTPYFAALTRVWEQRTSESAQSLVVGMFPILLAESDTMAAADDWLAANRSAAPSLRRLVGESRDGVARALRAQQRDAAS